MKTIHLACLIIIPCLLTLFLIPPVSAQWGFEERITFNDSASYTSANNAWCIAATGDTVHLAWFDYRDGRHAEIYYKQSTNGGASWRGDTRLTQDTSESLYPSLAVANPSVYLVWEDHRSGNNEIYFKRSTDAGFTWEQDARLTYTLGSSSRPSAGTAGSMIHVAWMDSSPGNWEIYYQHSTDEGITWGAAARLTNHPAKSYNPSTAALGPTVHVAWVDSMAGNWEIYYQRSTDGGITWGPNVRLTNDLADSHWPSVAASGSHVYVVWQDNRNGNYEIYGKRSIDQGISWGLDVRLTNDPAGSYNPSVSASGPNVHLVWYDGRSSVFYGDIYYKLSTDNGVTWGMDTQLSFDPYRSERPSVTTGGSKVHAVWCDNRYGNFEIFYARNSRGNIGVEGNSGVKDQRTKVGFKAQPNPFFTSAGIQGHEGEHFALYDIAGKLVGTFQGDRIGEGLSPGVYFVRGKENTTVPFRIVKLK